MPDNAIDAALKAYREAAEAGAPLEKLAELWRVYIVAVELARCSKWANTP